VEAGWGQVDVFALVGYGGDSEDNVLHLVRFAVTHPCCSEPV
jgi:hypothetical protein